MATEMSCASHVGRPLRALRGEGFRLQEARYPPESRIPPHAHARPRLCVVVDGGYVEEIGSSRLDVGLSSVLFHPAGAAHANRFSVEGARCLNVALLPEEMGAGGRVVDRLERAGRIRHGPPRWLASKLAAELELQDELSPVSVAGFVSAALCDLARGAAPALREDADPPPWLEAVRRRLHEEFRAHPSLSELAEDAGVHRAHVARAFRRHFGCSVGEFVRHRRIQFACRQLRDPDRTLSAIAYASGFADQSHFTRTFRKLVGTTPGRYRERYASGGRAAAGGGGAATGGGREAPGA